MGWYYYLTFLRTYQTNFAIVDSVSENLPTPHQRLLTVFPLITIFFGVLVLVGWYFDIQAFIRIIPSFSGMNPMTAISFILVAIAFQFLIHKDKGYTYRSLSILFSVLILGISVARIAELAFGAVTNIDLLLFSQKIINAIAPARMAFATAVSFAGLSATYIFANLKKNIAFTLISQIGLLVSVGTAAPALFFYFGNGVIFLETPLYFSMSLHTAMLFVLLSFAYILFSLNVLKTKLYVFDLKVITVILFLSIPTWKYLVAPQVEKLPTDFSYTAEIFSVDNLYDPETESYSGEILSNTTFSYNVLNVYKDAYDIKNIFDVRTPNGEPIFSVERLYGVDPYTREHLTEYGDRERTGYLFAPQNLNKQDFTYWHVNYDQPIEMKFIEEEEIGGLAVYKYSSDFQADQTKNLTNLPEVGISLGVNLDATINLWIEPISSRLIKYEDSAVAYYYDLQNNQRIYPWNKFSNRYSTAAIEKQVSIARQEIQQLEVTETTVPFSLLIFAGTSFALVLLNRYNKKYLNFFLPVLILAVSMGMTYFTWKLTSSNVEQQATAKFESEIVLMENIILDRLEIYSNALESGRGLFESSDEVNREEWKKFVNGINIQGNYPGVQGMGYAVVLDPDEVADFEQEIRTEGYADFTVFPEGERDTYTSIKYLEPFDERNKRAFGYDMFSETVRRTAMEFARDNDTTSITGKVLLLQELEGDVQPGFLMYVPLYETINTPDSIVARRNQIVGYIYSPFRMHDFMRAALFNQSFNIDVEVFDGRIANEETEMFDSDLGEFSRNNQYDPRFEKTKTIIVQGHPWTVRYISLPNYGLGDFQENYPALILRIGLVLSFLLAGITYSLVSSRARALNLADQMTADLQKKTQDLEQQKKKDETILANIGDGLTATDDQGRVILANHAFTTILGWTEEEIIGKKLSEIVPMLGKDGKKIPVVQRPLSKVLQTGKKITSSENSYMRKDSSVVPVNITISPIVLNGKITGIIEIFKDITKQREVDRMKTEFLSLASHQLRTPLSAMKWFLEILLEKETGKLSANQTDLVTKIQQSNDRMIELVNGLLNVSRLEQGRIAVEPEPTDMKKLIQGVLSELSVVTTKKKQTIEAKLNKNLTLNIDPKLIRQVFINLLSNASKYSDDGTKIIVTETVAEKEVVYSVIDQGYGIPVEEQPKIFNKFFRASNVTTKVTDGNGLGLYLIKQIIEVSGGKMWFESTEGKGTTFSFSLPLIGSKMIKGEKTLEG